MNPEQKRKGSDKQSAEHREDRERKVRGGDEPRAQQIRHRRAYRPYLLIWIGLPIVHGTPAASSALFNAGTRLCRSSFTRAT